MNTNRKGQAALEFLTTYGWAFLIILVMIGALSYFGVLNPTKFVPDSCTFASPFTCDAAVVNADNVVLRIRNNAESLVITSFVVEDTEDGSALEGIDALEATDLTGSCSLDVDVDTITCAAGSVATITFDADDAGAGLAFTAGLKKKLKVDINYYYSRSGSTFGKSTGGDIVSTVQ